MSLSRLDQACAAFCELYGHDSFFVMSNNSCNLLPKNFGKLTLVPPDSDRAMLLWTRLSIKWRE